MSNEVISIVDIVSGGWQVNQEVNNRYLEFMEAITAAHKERDIVSVMCEYSQQAPTKECSFTLYPPNKYKPLELHDGYLLILESTERIKKTTPGHLRHALPDPDGSFEREIARCFYNSSIHAPSSRDDMLGIDRFRGGQTYHGVVLTGRFRRAR